MCSASIISRCNPQPCVEQLDEEFESSYHYIFLIFPLQCWSKLLGPSWATPSSVVTRTFSHSMAVTCALTPDHRPPLSDSPFDLIRPQRCSSLQSGGGLAPFFAAPGRRLVMTLPACETSKGYIYLVQLGLVRRTLVYNNIEILLEHIEKNAIESRNYFPFQHMGKWRYRQSP